MFANSLSSCSRYNAIFKLDQSQCSLFMTVRHIFVISEDDHPRTVTQARDIWWTLDFANAFVSPAVNSLGELIPSYGASRRRLRDYTVYYATTLPCLLRYYLTTLLPYYLTTLLLYYLTTLLPYYATNLLPYYATTLLLYYAYYATIILPYYLTTLLGLLLDLNSPRDKASLCELRRDKAS
jgi:hypothetical protein